ncbi:SDR family NAD(P)-dependent oxidoreductase [Streptomyces flaveolus]|uniref:SDR family NAD(P)-dependent oxidoreductase n=1 Tax=Streptomyces flaveolus TaxID=67297 RepID=UPI0033AE0849
MPPETPSRPPASRCSPTETHVGTLPLRSPAAAGEHGGVIPDRPPHTLPYRAHTNAARQRSERIRRRENRRCHGSASRGPARGGHRREPGHRPRGRPDPGRGSRLGRLVARSAGHAEEQAALLREETGAEVIAVPADTGDDTSVAETAREVRERLGGVDILVNNAATTHPGVFPDDALEAEIDVKVRGYLRCARAFAPAMTGTRTSGARRA